MFDIEVTTTNANGSERCVRSIPRYIVGRTAGVAQLSSATALSFDSIKNIFAVSAEDATLVLDPHWFSLLS